MLELDHMLNINRKAHLGSPLMRLHLTLVTLKVQCQGDSDFRRLISRNGAAELGHMLLSNTNRKSYMASPIII